MKLFHWFSRKTEPSIQQGAEPVIGEYWEVSDGSPWPREVNFKIIDIKEGWVLYRGKYGTEGRVEMEHFLRILRKVPDVAAQEQPA